MKFRKLFILACAFLIASLFSCSQNEESVSSGEIDNPSSENALVLSETNITFENIALSESKTLTATLDGKSESVTWTIENPYIASVDQNGKVTPLSGGKTTVKAVSKTDSTKSGVCQIEIPEPARSVTSDPFDLKTITEEIDIFCCGDSIMRDYGANDADQYGLGQALKLFFDGTKANVVTDIANGGRSSRLFYNEESRWPEVKRRIQANNEIGKKSVVILSFGHNDQRVLNDVDKTYGAQFTFATKNENGTVAGTHQDFMEKYIVEARALGAVPVLLTPFVRGNYEGSEVSAYGKHDWSNKTMTGDNLPRGNYPEGMKNAAKKQNAILVDMTELSAKRVSEYNNDGKEKYFYVDSDNTHERTLGGLELAKLVTDELKKQGYLTNYIKETESRILVGKSSLAFGRLLVNASKTTSFRISNFNNSNGIITVTAPNGFSVGLTSDGTFSSSIEIPTTSDFIGCDVYVKFSPAEIISYNGDLTVTHTNVTPDFGNVPAGTVEGNTLKIALTGAGKDKSATGSAVTVNWPMTESNTLSLKSYSTSEDLFPQEAKLVGLQVTSNKTLPDGTTCARVTIEGGTWPVNDTGAKMENVYLEYAIPASGVELTVNKISFSCCSSGGSYMNWSAYYSTNADFTNPDPICELKNGTKEVLHPESIGGDAGTDEALGLPVADGETLYIRVYPVYKDTKENTGRGFIIKDVKVEGLLN